MPASVNSGVEKNTDRFRVIASPGLLIGLTSSFGQLIQTQFTAILCHYGKLCRGTASESNIVCQLRFQSSATQSCDRICAAQPALANQRGLEQCDPPLVSNGGGVADNQFDDRLEIVIADNGCRLTERGAGGNGLTNIRERLEALHGECHIESEPGKGTTVKCIVPLPRGSEPGCAAEESHQIT